VNILLQTTASILKILKKIDLSCHILGVATLFIPQTFSTQKNSLGVFFCSGEANLWRRALL